MSNSDDDSSDSSNDFAGITSKDELTASFFSINPATRSKPADPRSDSDESSDDDNFANVPENNDIELFSEVVKNLEASQRVHVNDQEVRSKQHSSKDDAVRNVKEIKIEKKRSDIADEINAVLLQGESGAFHENDGDTDEDAKEPEDVKGLNDYSIPKEGVKITLPGTSAMLFKKKPGRKETDLAAILRRKLKANQIIIEKAARLCWLAYGFYLNRLAIDPEVMQETVSLISTKNCPTNDFDLAYLAKFTKWFRNVFTVESSHGEVIINKEMLFKRIKEKKICNYRELVVLYVAILRGIGLHCRLVVSLNPPLVRTFNELLPKPSTTKKNGKTKEPAKEMKPDAKDVKPDAKETKGKSKQSKRNTKKTNSNKDLADDSAIQNGENARRNANAEAKKRAAEILRSKYSCSKSNKDKLDKNSSARSSASTSKDIEGASKSKADTILSPKRLRSSKIRDAAGATKQEHDIASKSNPFKPSGSKRQSRSSNSDWSSEEEKSLNESKRKRANNGRTVAKSKEKNAKTKQQSTDDDDEDDSNDKLKKRQDIWAEVYVESKGSWICVNVLDPNVDCITEVYVSIIHIYIFQ